jgi:glycosyltransferase involved in cell wall biosynthesis
LKKKIAIVRGANLNKWEIQNYEPLTDRYDITAYTTIQTKYDISQIEIPIVQLPFQSGGLFLYMEGLEDHLADKSLIFTADISYIFSAQAIVAKQKFGNKVVCLEWENIPFNYDNIKAIKRTKEMVRNGADHFIAVTKRAKEALILEGVPEEMIDVIHMGIDLNRFRPSKTDSHRYREQLGINKEDIVILFIGRMVWEKGVYDLIHAAAKILCDSSLKKLPIRFFMVGNGPELKELRGRTARLGISRYITFLENYPYHKIHRLHNVTDIFVLPSISTVNWQEQFGMVLIESMACGKPVISTLSGSIPEVVGNGGILIQPNDHLSLYEALKKLILNKELREEIGKNALLRAESIFDSKKVAEKIEMVFEKLLSEKCDIDNNKLNVIQKVSDTKKREYEKDVINTELLNVIPKEAKKILHVGCSDGSLGKAILDRGVSEVIGIEMDIQLYEEAKKNLSKVIYGDIEDIYNYFEEKYFDCIIFSNTIERMKYPVSTLQKVKKYLADSGVIIASIANARHYHIIDMLVEGNWKFNNSGKNDTYNLIGLSNRDIETIFREAGFEISGMSSKTDPEYNKLEDPYSGKVSFGKIVLKGLKPEELKNLFVSQFLVKAQKAGQEIQKVNEIINAALGAGNLEEAKKSIEAYLELHPVDMDMLYKHADVCYRLGQFDRALESLNRIFIFESKRKDALELQKEIIKKKDQKINV